MQRNTRVCLLHKHPSAICRDVLNKQRSIANTSDPRDVKQLTAPGLWVYCFPQDTALQTDAIRVDAGVSGVGRGQKINPCSARPVDSWCLAPPALALREKKKKKQKKKTPSNHPLDRAKTGSDTRGSSILHNHSIPSTNILLPLNVPTSFNHFKTQPL